MGTEMKTRLIVNPASSRGKMARRYPQIEQILRAESFAFDAVFTERRGHATQLARAAIDAGYELIVAVGGDGTLNEVVNGMVTQDGKAVNPNAALGVISSGTGSDFVRTANIPRDMLLAARHLARATQNIPLDLGTIMYRLEGKPAARHFANVTGMGFDAQVIARLERGGKRGGGTIPYYSALLATISNFHNLDLTLTIDGKTVRGKMNPIVVCNGKYFGGGMMIGPNATLNDGKFHVVFAHDLSALELLLATPKLYNGTILTHPKVIEYVAESVMVESQQPVQIQADGELIGEGPATFRILPAALKLRM
jgi:YegS/Rv2252/BmrU family lipid kinase